MVAELDPDLAFVSNVLQMEMDRWKYVMASYLRCRIAKVRMLTVRSVWACVP